MALRAGYYGIKRKMKYMLADIIGAFPDSASSSNKLATASDVANCMTWEANAKTGAVNICKLLDGTYSYVLDKTVDYNTGTITITGTPTSTGWSEGVVYNIILPAGTYKARCTSQTGNLNLLLNWDTQGVVTPEGIIFTTDGTKTVKFAWNVTNGTAVDYSAVGVMITTPDYKGDYVPYAMTNRELTEKVQTLETSDALKLILADFKTLVSSAADFAAFQTAVATYNPTPALLSSLNTSVISDPDMRSLDIELVDEEVKAVKKTTTKKGGTK